MKREEAIERLTDLVKTYAKFKDDLLYAKGDIKALTIAINDMKEMTRIKIDGDLKELKTMDKLEIVINNMCDNYCKYPYIWDEETEGASLADSGICDRCPLNELEKIKNDSYQINVKLKHEPVENDD